MAHLMDQARNWFNAGLGLIYPETCQLCHQHRAPARAGFVCAACWSQVRFIREPFCTRCGLPFAGDISAPFECSNCRDLTLYFRSARSAVVAKTVVLEAIHHFKYSRALWFEPFLADLFLRAAAPDLRGQPWDFIMPVPLHPLKEREREFNQAEIFARHLSQATSIPLHTKLLARVLPTATQTLLSRTQRAQNMAGAFKTHPDSDLKGKCIVIVDDIFTTGATTNDCARALRLAGATDVCVWTVARGL